MMDNDLGSDAKKKRKTESIEYDDIEIPSLDGGRQKSRFRDHQTTANNSFELGPPMGPKSIGQRVSRTFDRLFDKDYGQYRKFRYGKTKLSQYSTKELAYLKRDRAIEGKDISDIERLVEQRKFDAKAFRQQHSITVTDSIKTVKATVRIGLNDKGQMFFSTSAYRESPTIMNWQRLDKRSLADHFREQGGAEIYEIRSHNLNIGSVARNHLSELRERISVNLQKISLPDSKFTVNGSITQVDDIAEKLRKKQERVRFIPEIRPTALIDGKHVFGKDLEGNIKIGRVKGDNTVTWTSKDEYMNGLTSERRKKFEERIANRVSHVMKVGSAKGVDLYAGRTAKNEEVLTANRDTWVKAKSAVGSQLLSLAGFENFASAIKKGSTIATNSEASITSKPIYEYRNSNQIST